MPLEESLVHLKECCALLNIWTGRVRQWGTAFRPLDEIFLADRK